MIRAPVYALIEPTTDVAMVSAIAKPLVVQMWRVRILKGLQKSQKAVVRRRRREVHKTLEVPHLHFREVMCVSAFDCPSCV